MDRLETYTDPSLTRQDLLVLKSLLNDIDRAKLPSINGCGTSTSRKKQNGVEPRGRSLNGHGPNGAQRHSTNSPKAADGAPASGAQVNGVDCTDESIIKTLDAINDPSNADFEPTVFFTWDLKDLKLPSFVNDYLLQPYIRAATKLVRVETDVVVLTHLILYFTTSVPSALFLYYRFHWLHGIAHWLMQAWYVGTYTLMMHQHIHMNGVLARSCWLFDGLFPYITNPLMGHTWNSYYYHHVKHHHVEGNGPGDLSSTIYYQRDDPFHFLCYLGRFFFFAWLELPLYFVRKGKPVFAAKAAFWELSNYLAMYILARLNWRPTLFVFILPFVVLRVALMVGNWGQHALVDEIEPDSDFRSSITLIDVTVRLSRLSKIPSLANNIVAIE